MSDRPPEQRERTEREDFFVTTRPERITFGTATIFGRTTDETVSYVREDLHAALLAKKERADEIERAVIHVLRHGLVGKQSERRLRAALSGDAATEEQK